MDANGNLPFFLDAERGDLAALTGIPISMIFHRNNLGYSALDVAYNAGKMEMVDYLRGRMYNPELVLEEGPNYRLIQDGYLPGGTKQRVMVEYLASRTAEEFVYAGPTTGYAQVALAICAQLVGKKATVVVGLFPPGRTELTNRAEQAGAKILDRDLPKAPLERVKTYAQAYVQKTQGAELIPFGLESEDLINLLAVNISSAVPMSLRMKPPHRLWLVVGSGVILRALAQVWPETIFLCVRVGMKIWPDILAQIPHYQTFDNEGKDPPIPFWEPARLQPPYPTIPTYDAKLWSHYLRHHQPNDWIWNVASD